MVSSKVRHIGYVDSKGKETSRVVYVIHPVTDTMLALDLSEFDKDEQEYYTQELTRIDDMVKQEIAGLGLRSNYRNFKKDRTSVL